LRNQNVLPAESGPFEQLLREWGQRHEEHHQATYPELLDLSHGTETERFDRTLDGLRSGTVTLYQPFFKVERQIDGRHVQLVGSPDFMVPDRAGWRIRDTKLSRDIDKPEIIAQLNLYGLLLEDVLGEPPLALEAVLGNNEIAVTPYQGADAVVDQVRLLLHAMADTDDYEPVGWSKCSSCGYFDHCWPEAEAKQDIALLTDVDQGLARQLHLDGCTTVAQLHREYGAATLAELRRPWGNGMQAVGVKATSVLNHARSFLEDQPIVLALPELPDAQNLVMFDLEGLPPHLDEIEEIFLWGVKICGQDPSPFRYSCTFPGRTNDEATWFAFLDLAESIFDEHGDIPFVHWASYEKTKLDLYVSRYSDRDGLAARVRANLLDLLNVARDSVCLPLPSRSLKQVEKYVGFERKLPGSGDWAIAQYIRANESDDADTAVSLLNDILQYNEEDLDATWAVYCWLRDQVGTQAD